MNDDLKMGESYFTLPAYQYDAYKMLMQRGPGRYEHTKQSKEYNRRAYETKKEMYGKDEMRYEKGDIDYRGGQFRKMKKE